MNGLYVGLHAMSTWEDGVVPLSWEGLDGFRIGGWFFSIPGTNVFAAVICLPHGFFGEYFEFFEEVVDIDGEELGVGQGDVVGESQEKNSTGDFSKGILNLWEVESTGLKIILWDVHEIFGVFHGLLEQLKEFFDRAQIIFCDVFLGAFS